MVAGTLQTDPRSGGIKRSSGVNVLPIVAETWSQVRNDSNPAIDWLIAGYVPSNPNDAKSSKPTATSDITVLHSGCGGIEVCASSLPIGQVVFGGVAIHTGTHTTRRFVTFFYCDETAPTMLKGRASLHKNGVLNVLEGSDCEIEIRRGMTESDLSSVMRGSGGNRPPPPKSRTAQPFQQQQQQQPVVGVGASATTTSGMPLHRESKAVATKPASSLSRVQNSNPTTTNTTVVASTSSNSSSNTEYAIIPYDQLVDGMLVGIDPACKERYLSNEEFGRIFGITKEEFERLPVWKRTALKKQHGLF